MKINPSGYINNNQSFKSLYNNRLLLSGLEQISKHGASFIAAANFAGAMFLRPAAIALTPGIDKENKKYFEANSVTSAVSKLVLTEAVALPVEFAINKIDKNPEKYMGRKLTEKLKGGADTLKNSAKYNDLKQIIKLSPALLTAIPKALLTVSLIPFAVKLFSKDKNKNVYENLTFNDKSGVFSEIEGNRTETSFKGSNIARNMSMATDALLTASFVAATVKDKKIEKERKKPLIYNNLISSAISLVGGYTLDKAVQKGTADFVEKFKDANKTNPKLNKYIEGINILRPTLIFAGIYYGILPMISAYTADKAGSDKTKFVKLSQ